MTTITEPCASRAAKTDLPSTLTTRQQRLVAQWAATWTAFLQRDAIAERDERAMLPPTKPERAAS